MESGQSSCNWIPWPSEDDVGQLFHGTDYSNFDSAYFDGYGFVEKEFSSLFEIADRNHIPMDYSKLEKVSREHINDEDLFQPDVETEATFAQLAAKPMIGNPVNLQQQGQLMPENGSTQFENIENDIMVVPDAGKSSDESDESDEDEEDDEDGMSLLEKELIEELENDDDEIDAQLADLFETDNEIQANLISQIQCYPQLDPVQNFAYSESNTGINPSKLSEFLPTPKSSPSPKTIPYSLALPTETFPSTLALPTTALPMTVTPDCSKPTTLTKLKRRESSVFLPQSFVLQASSHNPSGHGSLKRKEIEEETSLPVSKRQNASNLQFSGQEAHNQVVDKSLRSRNFTLQLPQQIIVPNEQSAVTNQNTRASSMPHIRPIKAVVSRRTQSFSKPSRNTTKCQQQFRLHQPGDFMDHEYKTIIQSSRELRSLRLEEAIDRMISMDCEDSADCDIIEDNPETVVIQGVTYIRADFNPQRSNHESHSFHSGLNSDIFKIDNSDGRLQGYPRLWDSLLTRDKIPEFSEYIVNGVNYLTITPVDNLYDPIFRKRLPTDRENEGWCDCCGQWLQLRNNSYAHHMKSVHGVSSNTKTLYECPTKLRGNCPDEFEGFCANCNHWIPLSIKKRHPWLSWFIHQYRRETKGDCLDEKF